MLDGALGLRDGAALDGEDDVAFGLLANLDDALPVNHALTAGAAHGRAGDLAALGVGLLDGNVLRVQVDEASEDALEPLVRIVAA